MLACICTALSAITLAVVLLTVAQTHTIQVPQRLFVYGINFFLLHCLLVVLNGARKPEWAVDERAQRYYYEHWMLYNSQSMVLKYDEKDHHYRESPVRVPIA